MTVLEKRVSQVSSIEPAFPLGLRRRGSDELVVGPFSLRRRSERYRPRSLWNRRMDKNQIVLNYKGKMVYKERNYWLVLTRTLLAGFDAHIDIPLCLFPAPGSIDLLIDK